ncbi:MAG: thiamine pyrophosphate-dependent enzyme [Shimia sp.]
MSMTGGECLVRSLEGLGATQAFGVPGESYLAVLDALHDSSLRLDLTRHEGGAAFMAEAWAKLTGEVGVCFVTRGPGATNASIGVHSAMQASTPMVLFIGQVARSMAGREAFQEVDYRAAFGPLAKWVTQIEDADRIPEILSRVWHVAQSGRPGPVVVALPEDMLTDMTEAAPLTAVVTPPQPWPAPDAVTAMRAALEGAQRPLVIVGGGGWTDTARSMLPEVLDTLGAPVLAAFRYHDLLDHDAPWFAGVAGVGMTPQVRGLMQGADCILALGIRWGEMTTDGWSIFDVPDGPPMLIHAHPDVNELGKIYAPDIALHAGPEGLLDALRGTACTAPDWQAAAHEGYLASLAAPEQPGTLDMRAVVAALQEQLDDDAILTNGAGNFAVWTNRFFRFGPRHRLLAPQSGAMGYGVPAAIAAKRAQPKRQVVCIAGDGDFQMTSNELGAAMQMGACPVIVIVNNGTYGTIRMHQEREYPARVSGTALENPDFVTLAAAYRFDAQRVERTEEFAPALIRALASPTGAVIELMVGPEALTPGKTLSQIRADATPPR